MLKRNFVGFLMQMVPMTITKEYWALILTMLRLDSAGFPMIGSSSEQNQHLQMFHLSTNVSFEQLFLNKIKPIQEKKKTNGMKLDL